MLVPKKLTLNLKALIFAVIYVTDICRYMLHFYFELTTEQISHWGLSFLLENTYNLCHWFHLVCLGWMGCRSYLFSTTTTVAWLDLHTSLHNAVHLVNGERKRHLKVSSCPSCCSDVAQYLVDGRQEQLWGGGVLVHSQVRLHSHHSFLAQDLRVLCATLSKRNQPVSSHLDKLVIDLICRGDAFQSGSQDFKCICMRKIVSLETIHWHVTPKKLLCRALCGGYHTPHRSLLGIEWNDTLWKKVAQ